VEKVAVGQQCSVDYHCTIAPYLRQHQGLWDVKEVLKFKSQQGQEAFSSPQCPDPFWGPTCFLFTGYRGSFPGYSGWGMMVITLLHLALRWKIFGVSTHPKNNKSVFFAEMMMMMIYLLMAIGLSPGGSNTHLHTNNT